MAELCVCDFCDKKDRRRKFYLFAYLSKQPVRGIDLCNKCYSKFYQAYYKKALIEKGWKITTKWFNI